MNEEKQKIVELKCNNCGKNIMPVTGDKGLTQAWTCECNCPKQLIWGVYEEKD